MSRPTLHLICNAHLDPVWQWRWEEGAGEALSTFRAAVEILEEHDELVFNHNEAVLYRWVERYDPALFERIRDLVRRERWAIAGGWYLQPDANLPGVESFFRHIAVGRRYFESRFGVRPRVAYNFDSFGHTAGLPQILRQSGFEMYVHMRPDRHDLDLPGDLYRWRGADGSEIAALRIAVGLYHTERDNIVQRLEEGTELALRLDRDVPVFWGLGDHGGGATREDLARIAEFCVREERVEIRHSTTERLWDSLREAARVAPVVDGDLQRVFPGCYTSLSRLKRRARENLGGIVQAESLCAGASWGTGANWPADELADSWRSHLFCDFHDILPGTCTEPAERDSHDQYGHSSELWRRSRLAAASAFARFAPGPASLPVTVLNASGHAGPAPVDVEFMIDHRPLWEGEWHVRLFTADGREVACQEEQPEARLPFGGWRRKISFVADLPALGASFYRVEKAPGAPPKVSASPSLEHSLDSGAGLVASIAAAGHECLAGPLLQPCVVVDEGDSWGTECWRLRDVVGRFELDGDGVTRVEDGPVRRVDEAVLRFGASRIVARTIAYADEPVIELCLRVTWNEERRRLVLVTPTTFAGAPLECEVPGGTVVRPADGDVHVHGRWWCLLGGDAALGIANSGQHAVECSDGEVRLTALRSAVYCHERGLVLPASPEPKFMDHGVHEVRLLITAGTPEDVRDRLPALADRLDAGPYALAHLPHGVVGGEVDLRTGRAWHVLDVLSLEPRTIRLVAAKIAERGEDLIVRVQESSGRKTTGRLRVYQPPTTVELELGPHEIRTIRVGRDGEARFVDPIGEE